MANTRRHRNRGVRKVCAHTRRAWATCEHSWYFSLQWEGTHYRFALDRYLGRHVAGRDEAEAEAATLRLAIKAGEFGDKPSPDAPLTFGDVVDCYLERHVRVPTRRPPARQMMEWHLARLLAAEVPASGGGTVRLEQRPINQITKADVEAIRTAIRARYRAIEAAPEDEKPMRRPGTKGGEIGINRLLARLRHVFSFAIAEGYATETPFKRHGVTVVKLETKAETARTRRLAPGEEAALLHHAGHHLRGVIVAALSTGCRLGEILGLQWSRIRRDDQGEPRWLVLEAGHTKTNEARVIPIGPRLRAELEMRQTDPAGVMFGPDAYVFGDVLGQRVGSVKKAWGATCRRAGILGLHFHDLRREFGSRLLESGASHHDVRDFLGHANITTTSRYLKTTPLRLERALAQMEARQDESCKELANEDLRRDALKGGETPDNRLQ